MFTQATDQDIVIVAAKRSPIGSFQGQLAKLSSVSIAAQLIDKLWSSLQLPKDLTGISAYLGCVLQAGQGQNPARQSIIGAGLGHHIPATTINKVCGSGLLAVCLADQALRCQQAEIVIAGGQESMSQAPYLVSGSSRSGLRFGHQQLVDHMLYDGLEDAYHPGSSMGLLAESCSKKYQFSREDQETFAKLSLERALQANERGFFQEEIIPISCPGKPEAVTISQDEGPSAEKLAKMTKLKPAFAADGTITAATASALADGAAAVVVMRMPDALKKSLTPIARIVGYTVHAHEPEWFTTAPVSAIERLLQQIGWDVNSVDFWEINEAFAVVPMAVIHSLALDRKRVNIHGGACALGHPIGASGCRLLVTLIHALHRYQKKRGIVSLCVGGGEAVALAIEV